MNFDKLDWPYSDIATLHGFYSSHGELGISYLRRFPVIHTASGVRWGKGKYESHDGGFGFFESLIARGGKLLAEFTLSEVLANPEYVVPMSYELWGDDFRYFDHAPNFRQKLADDDQVGRYLNECFRHDSYRRLRRVLKPSWQRLGNPDRPDPCACFELWDTRCVSKALGLWSSLSKSLGQRRPEFPPHCSLN